MLREAPLFCPFGADFEDCSSNEMTPKALNASLCDVSRWLALMELDGFAFGSDHSFQGKAVLPYCFTKVVQEIVKVRSAGPRSNAIADVEDLAASLFKEPCFQQYYCSSRFDAAGIAFGGQAKVQPFWHRGCNTAASRSSCC